MESSYTEDELRRRIRNQERDISKLNHENDILNDQIARIEFAKKRVQRTKRDYEELREATHVIIKKDRNKWKGENYRQCEEKFDYLYRTADKNAYYQIDDVLDALEREQGAYERKKENNNGLIGTLQNGINWCWHEIKTWFN